MPVYVSRRVNACIHRQAEDWDNSRAQAEKELAQGLTGLESALHGKIEGSGVIPDEWHRIAQRQFEGPKQKVTLWVEEDAVAFFKSLGKGHTTKMADVLKAFMHARIAGAVPGPEDHDYSHSEAEQRAAQADMRRRQT